LESENEVFDQLVEEWVNKSKDHWIPGTEVSVDESIYARKPHKNGLLAWVMATKSYETNKPYVLDIIPHLLKLRNPFVSGQDSIREFMNRWAHPNKVHIVADAAFGSMKLQ